MPIAKQLTVMLQDRPGALAQLCSELAKVAVNIQSIESGQGDGLVPVRLLVSQTAAATKVCAALGLKWTEEDVLAVLVDDRPGALGKITRKLAEQNINIARLHATVAKGSKRVLVVLAVSDVAAASRLIR